MTRHRAATAHGSHAPFGYTPSPSFNQATLDFANVGDSSSLPTQTMTDLTPSPTPHTSISPSPTLKSQLPSMRFVCHQDSRAARPSLIFPTISRTLPYNSAKIRVGRYSERDTSVEAAPNQPSDAPVGFKSKVVSRRHCEFWFEDNQWYIKDVKSSSGTFLNHIRLSQPGVESRPWVVNDGDIVQLGIDFKGGEEMIFRCAKIRVECNRGWQKGLNKFNKSTHRHLRNLAKKGAPVGIESIKEGDAASMHSTECSICLMSIAPCQSLFVAPCSHTWHYKCIRPVINGPKWPQFQCPNCRAWADLEADVDEPYDESNWDEEEEDNLTELKVTSSPEASVGSDPIRTDEPDQMNMDALARHTTNASLHATSTTDTMSTITPITSNTCTIEFLDSPDLTHHSVASDISDTAPGEQDRRTHKEEPIQQRSTTPCTSEQQVLLAEPFTDEGPLTPRNTAGPFVFDGSAGRQRHDSESLDSSMVA